MKKLFLLLVVILSVLTTGCTKVDTTLTIDNDKSASVFSRLEYNGDLSNDNDIGATTIERNYKNFLDKDYDVTEQDNHIIASKKVENVQKHDLDLRSLGFVSNLPDGKFVSVKKNFFVTSYNIDVTYNLPRQFSRIETAKHDDIKSLKPVYLQEYADRNEIITDNADDFRMDFIDNFEDHFGDLSSAIDKNTSDGKNVRFDINNFSATFGIKVPSFASYNNADRLENLTYIWDLRKESPTLIRFQYVEYSGFAIGFVILIGVFGLIYIARRIRRHDALKRIGNSN